MKRKTSDAGFGGARGRPAIDAETQQTGSVTIGTYIDYFRSGGVRGSVLIAVFVATLIGTIILQIFCARTIGNWKDSKAQRAMRQICLIKIGRLTGQQPTIKAIMRNPYPYPRSCRVQIRTAT